MKSPGMPDFYQPLNQLTGGHTLPELLTYIKELERARSIWDARIRLCEEREYMYKTMLADVCEFLAQVFQANHDHTSETGAKATELIEAVHKCMKKLET